MLSSSTRHNVGSVGFRSLPTTPASLLDRVKILEEKVDALLLLPARMDALELQILQFAEEFRGEFSAIRKEMQEMRDDNREGHEETRRHMRVLYEDLIQRISRIQHG
jgi:hypothetical protein